MTEHCAKLVDSYVRWLRKNLHTAQIDGMCEITTPFVDRHNDYLQIYVRKEGEELILTDDGYVISDLKMSGCGFDSEHRSFLLRSIIAGFGVQLDDDDLIVKARTRDFPQKKHALIQAMLAIGDLFVTARPHVVNLFLDDVAEFLDASCVRYLTGVQFAGKSGFTHKFDFAIPKSLKAPERLVRAINRPSKDTATATIFSWTDIRQIRDEGARLYAFLNDSEKPVSSEVTDALGYYEIVPVLYTKRQDHAQELAA